MAAPGWHADRPLSAELRRDYARFDFYQLVRLLLRERAGEGGVAALDNRVRFRADLSLAFPAHEVSGLADETDGDRVAVLTPNYAVAGYLGPLPESFAEWVRERRAQGDRAMADFLDIFNHRVNVLRYRIKARTHPVLEQRPPEETAPAARLSAMIGAATPGLARRLPISRRALLGVAGLLANRRRTAAAIERVAARYLGAAVQVAQFQGAWQRIADEDRTQLGRRNGVLGRTAVLGGRVWDQAARIEVRIGPLPYARFRELLPGGAMHGTLAALLRYLTDRQVDCRVLLLTEGDPPPLRLASSPEEGARLAQTSWLPGRAGGPRSAAFLIPAYEPAAESVEHAA